MPWFFGLSRATPKEGWVSGYVYGFFFLLGQVSFIEQLVGHWTGSPILGCIPWILGTLVGSFYFAIFGWMAARLFQRGWVFWVPVAWTGMEVFRSYFPVLAFPWGLIGTPLSAFPSWVGAAHFISLYGIGTWIATLALLPPIIQRDLKFSKGVVAIIVLFPCFSVARKLQSAPQNYFLISTAQLGVDSGFGDPAITRPQLQKAAGRAEITAINAHSDLLVLPEATTFIPYASAPTPGFPVYPDMPIIFGAQRGTGPVYESAFGFDGKWSFLDKTRLVLFGEFVPGRSWIPYPDAFKLPSGDITTGSTLKSLRVGKFQVGPVICFEGLFPDIAWRQADAHAQIIAVMSEEDWFIGSDALGQLRDASIWRSIETGLPVIRSSTTGYTLITDSFGNVIASAPISKEATITASVPVPQNPPRPYWLFILPIGSLILGLGAGFWPIRKGM